jgi:hypothetical protein
MVEDVRPPRRRFKQQLPLRARLQLAAQECLEAAEVERSENERETLLRAAQRYRIAADLEEWLSSPGLRPPIG